MGNPCSPRYCIWDKGVTGPAGEGPQSGGRLSHTEELSQWLSWAHRARISMNFLEKVLPCQIWRDDYRNALACLLETSFCLCLFCCTGQVTLASSWSWALCLRLSPFCICPLAFVLFSLSSYAKRWLALRWLCLPSKGQRLSPAPSAPKPLLTKPCLFEFPGCCSIKFIGSQLLLSCLFFFPPFFFNRRTAHLLDIWPSCRGSFPTPTL